MKKLFTNVEGNRFKLLTENTEAGPSGQSLIASGLKKVFMNAGNTISYNHVESVGLGYIKDITTAKQTALHEARQLVKEHGFRDSEDDARFVRDTPSPLPLKKENDETDMSNPAEKREVQIGKKIQELVRGITTVADKTPDNDALNEILALAIELVKIHGQKE